MDIASQAVFERTQPVALPPEPLHFTGSGGEYFRIWIVNLLLTILTLGVYSAWAKVRRLQYFCRNTRLAGASFDYHGKPLAILKGRIIALALLLAYNFSFQIAQAFGTFMLIALAVVLPWLLRNSFRFRLHNSSYRGLRFSFRGTPGDAYLTFLLFGGLALLTGFLWPLFQSRLKKYQHNNSWFGQTRASFSTADGEFYYIYISASLAIAGLAVTMVFLLSGPIGHWITSLAQYTDQQPFAVLSGLVFAGAILLAWFLTSPYITARMQNLVWNRTKLGDHRFESRVSARKLFLIYLTNLILTVLTLGLFMPWAIVRTARYRLESLTLIPSSSLDEFVTDTEQTVAAVGEETAEFVDFDIAL